VATEPAPTRDFAGQVTQWSIFDAYLADMNAQIRAREERDSRKLKLGASAAAGEGDAEADATSAAADGEDSETAGDAAAAAAGEASGESGKIAGGSHKSADEVFFSGAMARALKIVERTVNQNADAHVYWDYKYFEDNASALTATVAAANALAPASSSALQPAVSSSSAEGGVSSSGAQTDGSGSGPSAAGAGSSSSGAASSAVSSLSTADHGSFLPLWRFTSDKAVKPRQTVTAVVWNKKFPDLVAVGFGSYDFVTNTRSGTGLVCCYSLKNAAHPEYTFETPSGVMSLDWHPTLSPLLVAGLHDGTVCVFDARKGGDKPLYSSSTPASRHMGPVWQVTWTASQAPLSFHSISTDGNFCSWVLNKTDLDKETVVELKLAHSNVLNVGDAADFSRSSAPLANAPVEPDRALVTLSGGTCFDFNPAIPMLVVGSEEGTISTYHTAYNSTLAQSFDGHSMAVYAVRWNQFHPNIFISCSADWTVKIWEHTTRNAIMTFDLHTSIGDVVWAPYKSTVFACVTSDGWLKLFDLAASRHEPVGEHRLSKTTKLSHLAFNPRDPIIAVGDDRGVSTVLKLSSALRRMNAASVDDLEPAQEQAALDKLLIIQDEHGKNKTITLIPPLVNQKKVDEAAAAEKRAAEVAAAAKAAKDADEDD
jgi:WD40 repeat protein